MIIFLSQFHQSTMWLKICNEKMMSSLFIFMSSSINQCNIDIWLLFFHIGFEIIFYDYNQLCNHLIYLIIDFLVVNSKSFFMSWINFFLSNLLRKLCVNERWQFQNINCKYSMMIWNFKHPYSITFPSQRKWQQLFVKQHMCTHFKGENNLYCKVWFLFSSISKFHHYIWINQWIQSQIQKTRLNYIDSFVRCCTMAFT
jgi:hypothetical protein